MAEDFERTDTRYRVRVERTFAAPGKTGGSWQQLNDKDWGNPPQVNCVKEVTELVYDQTVDELDLALLIIAVNNLAAFPKKEKK